MENICTLEPRAVWEIFAEICAIPHPSGHEKALADAIAAMAEQHGLKARRDAYGNLRIDRAASPGFETRSTVILQGHLDMVPQAEAGSLFDFEKDPIPAVADGGFVRSAAGTTLGGDNGIGVAAALALLFDESFHSGPLAAVFTLSEEIGLNGATALDPAFLAGKYLLNLDSEDEGELFIGCAGGARLEASFAPEYETPSPSFTGALLEGWRAATPAAISRTGAATPCSFSARRYSAPVRCAQPQPRAVRSTTRFRARRRRRSR